ncbi:hypothetical protein [Variibacter gotjawalensis]|uniref:hypothetical protein n=1 Tax=Variibacter gotjawalensis TaxID=1333996 RepID=UPI0013EE8FA2|nr:hypothetical protein [Variibacter gotjawalensis]NIK45772.1 hypothetical protein [Variibacter gotjawalensis]
MIVIVVVIMIVMMVAVIVFVICHTAKSPLGGKLTKAPSDREGSSALRSVQTFAHRPECLPQPQTIERKAALRDLMVRRLDQSRRLPLVFTAACSGQAHEDRDATERQETNENRVQHCSLPFIVAKKLTPLRAV